MNDLKFFELGQQSSLKNFEDDKDLKFLELESNIDCPPPIIVQLCYIRKYDYRDDKTMTDQYAIIYWSWELSVWIVLNEWTEQLKRDRAFNELVRHDPAWSTFTKLFYEDAKKHIVSNPAPLEFEPMIIIDFDLLGFPVSYGWCP